MDAIASQITSLTIVYSTVYSDADQRKHQSSASLAFVRRIPRWPANSPHKWPVTRKIFPFDDVVIFTENWTNSNLTKNSTNKMPSLVQIMSWRRTSGKPFSEISVVYFTDGYMRILTSCCSIMTVWYFFWTQVYQHIEMAGSWNTQQFKSVLLENKQLYLLYRHTIGTDNFVKREAMVLATMLLIRYSWGPFHLYGLILIPVWISNYNHCKV